MATLRTARTGAPVTGCFTFIMRLLASFITFAVFLSFTSSLLFTPHSHSHDLYSSGLNSGTYGLGSIRRSVLALKSDPLKPVPDTPSPPSIYSADGGFSRFSPEWNGERFGGGFGAEDGSILSPPTEMPAEEVFALREWRRQNAIRLEQKEKKEKEMIREIIEEAEQYKVEFYRKGALAVENNKASNREKEKLFLASWEKFHAEAEKNYWKAIAELIPYEVPAIEKRGKKKDQEKKKPSIIVIQGPKPGKPIDISRVRQILVKLKHTPPSHMNPKPLI